MQTKSLRIKSCRSWAIADTASEAAILALSSCYPRRWGVVPIADSVSQAMGGIHRRQFPQAMVTPPFPSFSGVARESRVAA